MKNKIAIILEDGEVFVSAFINEVLASERYFVNTETAIARFKKKYNLYNNDFVILDLRD